MSNLITPELRTGPSNSSADNETTWAVLAGLRGLFALIVLLCHVSQFTGGLHAINHVGGLAAVLGFFVISGYSIGHSIDVKRRGFYVRRAQRIYPLYLVACVLSLIPFWLYGHTIDTAQNLGIHGPKSAWTVVGNLFFLNGFVCDRLMSNAPAWSLSIEVCYYLFAPIFQRSKSWALAIIVLASSVLFVFADKFHIHDFSLAIHGRGALLLAWAWLVGFLYYRHSSKVWAQGLLLGLGTVLLCRFNEGGAAYAPALFAISMFFIIASPCIALSTRARHALNWAGEISYPLYIMHYPLMVMLSAHRAIRSPLVYLAVPVIGAIVSYYAVDLPFRRHAKRLRLSRAPGATQVP